MSKVVLFIVGVALLVTTVHYFVSLSTLTIVARPANNIEAPPKCEHSLLSVSGAFAADKEVLANSDVPKPTILKSTIPDPTTAQAIPLKTNPADSLRSALQSVVEDSIEQELWDEMESTTE